jgi:hypothetical protein
MDAQTRERLEELERALHVERAAHRRERELAAQALRRCELLEESVKRAYRLAAGGRRPREMETGN